MYYTKVDRIYSPVTTHIAGLIVNDPMVTNCHHIVHFSLTSPKYLLISDDCLFYLSQNLPLRIKSVYLYSPTSNLIGLIEFTGPQAP